MFGTPDADAAAAMMDQMPGVVRVAAPDLATIRSNLDAALQALDTTAGDPRAPRMHGLTPADPAAPEGGARPEVLRMPGQGGADGARFVQVGN